MRTVGPGERPSTLSLPSYPVQPTPDDLPDRTGMRVQSQAVSPGSVPPARCAPPTCCSWSSLSSRSGPASPLAAFTRRFSRSNRTSQPERAQSSFTNSAVDISPPGSKGLAGFSSRSFTPSSDWRRSTFSTARSSCSCTRHSGRKWGKVVHPTWVKARWSLRWSTPATLTRAATLCTCRCCSSVGLDPTESLKLWSVTGVEAAKWARRLSPPEGTYQSTMCSQSSMVRNSSNIASTRGGRKAHPSRELLPGRGPGRGLLPGRGPAPARGRPPGWGRRASPGTDNGRARLFAGRGPFALLPQLAEAVPGRPGCASVACWCLLGLECLSSFHQGQVHIVRSHGRLLGFPLSGWSANRDVAARLGFHAYRRPAGTPVTAFEHPASRLHLAPREAARRGDGTGCPSSGRWGKPTKWWPGRSSWSKLALRPPGRAT